MWFSCKDGEVKGPGTGTEREAARAAPRVPDERANAVEELRPSRLDISVIIPFFYKECITIRAGDDKVDLAWVKVVQRDVGACCGSLERA